MKHYKLFNEGDKVEILFSHSDDKGKIGVIKKVRNSFCVIEIDVNGKAILKNHCYGQFRKVI